MKKYGGSALMLIVSLFVGLGIGNLVADWLEIYDSACTNNIYVGDVTTDDDATVGDDATVNGMLISPPDTLADVQASTIVTPTSSFMVVDGTATGTLLTSTPNIATSAVDGSYLMLTAATTQVIYQDATTLAGSNLALGSSSRCVQAGDILTLLLRSNTWYEISWTDN